MPSTEDLLDALMKVERRADRLEDDKVVATYVDFRAIRSALHSTDNGVIFGRRGTGKTHALRYLVEKEREKGNFAAFIDMETDTGSTGGRYSDQSIPISERATRLLVDILAIVHSRLFDDARAGRTIANVDLLDRLASSLRQVVVVEDAEIESESSRDQGGSAEVAASINAAGANLTVRGERHDSASSRDRFFGTGLVRHRIHFGEVSAILRELLSNHEAPRCWIVIDEWTAVPIELQPYVAQMLRSLLFGLPKVTVRIAAIPHRAEWKILGVRGSYIGLEVGAELFPLFDLDDFAVFPASSRAVQKDRSIAFFTSLLYKHISQALRDAGLEELESPEQMVSLLFTQTTALHELAKAAEGVPRDALNIIWLAAGRVAEGSKVSTPDIRHAAASHFQTTKETHLNGVSQARQLIDAIRSDVIGTRKARAFLLLQQHARNPLIQQLMDDRILHLIKRGYSSPDERGIRYDVLEIDYGLYVDMLGTTGAPQGLLGEGEDEDEVMSILYGDVEVPEYDYRSIRRSILDLPTVLATFSLS